MALLYINADDFGLHPSVNEAIAKCADFGSVNSISVMANGQAPDYELLKRLQDKGVFIGAHITWVNEKWLTQPYHFSSWPHLFFKVSIGGTKFLKEMQEEAQEQIEVLKGKGIKLNHVDSHQHVHMLPGVWDIAVNLQQYYAIKNVRTPAAKNILMARQNPAGWVLQILSAIKSDGKLYYAGIKKSGNYLMWDMYAELRKCKGHDTMLIVHPGTNNRELNERYRKWHFDWENEFDALMRQKFLGEIGAMGFTLPRA